MGNGNKTKKTKMTVEATSHSRPPVSSEDLPPEPARVKEILSNTLDESRGGGDGESLPDTPPNERVSEAEKPGKMEAVEANLTDSTSVPVSTDAINPFKIQFSVDMMAVMLFVTGLVTRLYRLDQPRHVV